MHNEDLPGRSDGQKQTKKPARRPGRYQIPSICISRLERDQRNVLSQRLPGAALLVRQALEIVLGSEPFGADAQCHAAAFAALTQAGITPVLGGDTGNITGEVARCRIDTIKLRAAFPCLPKRFAQRFDFFMSVQSVQSVGSDFMCDEDDEEDFRSWPEIDPDTRYPCGVSECDALRMQTEILRLKLNGFDMSIDQALDDLCAGQTTAQTVNPTRCNRIAIALEEVGLRFHAINKSWRQPRIGGLLIARPNDLVAAYPEIEFFEPHQFAHVLIIDRQEKAGNEVKQGLLF